jgi:hypothetical protein
MNWNTTDVKAFLTQELIEPSGIESQINLSQFDPRMKIGVGRDGIGNIVLVLPGQSDVLAFSTEGASFEPWTNVRWIEGDKDLSEVATLRCNLKNPTAQVLSAVAAVFVGIIDLQVRFASCGEAIWEMKELFESKFDKQVSDNILIGLFGELLVIAKSTNRQQFVECWHSRNEASFDFSFENLRIEVKTAAETNREHYFSSNQIYKESSMEVLIASVLLRIVESGTTLDNIFQEILDELNEAAKIKFTNVVIKILGTTPNSVINFQIDRKSSEESILFYRGPEIPQPDLADGVISMKWKASLAGVEPTNIDINQVLSFK